jgi:hypothetical protein
MLVYYKSSPIVIPDSRDRRYRNFPVVGLFPKVDILGQSRVA